MLNPPDKHALEAALELKETHGGEITVVSMGPREAEEAIYEALAMGADRGVLLTDRAFAGADTLATVRVLAAAIRRLGEFDLILGGNESADGATGQVGAQLAEMLDLPHATYACGLELAAGGILHVRREIESSHALLEMRLPGMVTVVRSINEPRLPTPMGIIEAADKEVQKWGNQKLNLSLESIGLAGSPTQVVEVFPGQSRRGGQGLILANQPAAEAVRAALKFLN